MSTTTKPNQQTNNMKINHPVIDAIQSVKEAVKNVLIGTTSQVNKIQLMKLDLIKKQESYLLQLSELNKEKSRIDKNLFTIEKELLEVEKFLNWSDLVTKGVNSLHSKVSQAPVGVEEESERERWNLYSLVDAAELGDAKSQFNLANAYWFGNGVDVDQTEAVKWYRKAAEQGYCGCGRMNCAD